MTLNKEKTTQLVSRFGNDENNTGSVKVQIALLSEKIKDLADHFKTHPKDIHSRRGLVTMVSNRRRLLKYLTRTDLDGYKKLIKELNIRRLK